MMTKRQGENKLEQDCLLWRIRTVFLYQERKEAESELEKTCGMAKLAIVRPETRSDLKSLRLYLGPHWRIGNTYWAPRISFLLRGCPLNWRRGSSGKKVSLSLPLSFWRVLLWGGGTTWCTSMDISMQWECIVHALLVSILKRTELIRENGVWCYYLLLGFLASYCGLSSDAFCVRLSLPDLPL